MLNDKLFGYLGFARKAGKLRSGYNTCLSQISNNKVRLLIVAVDSSENTVNTMRDKCRHYETEMRVFGTKEDLSQVTGRQNSGIYAVLDSNFAEVIMKEIDRIQSEGEVIQCQKN